ncbi:MAG TPA: glycosyltransferase family 1 protein [Actinomycetota bacterium]|nr:glycosyltransferase family 1 protein [Actinomycetota bacterium]
MFLVPEEVGGSEPLLTNLALSMARKGTDLTVFAVKGFASAYPEIAAICEVVEVPWRRGQQAMRIAVEHSWLPMQLARRKIDIVHHGVGTTPFLKTIPEAVTIHDIQFRHYPKNFVMGKRMWLSVNVPHTLKRCRVICVPSLWVQNDLAEKFGVSEHKVAVVPFGSEDLFGPDPASAEEIREEYRLERPFFFFPGRAYPHKNHKFLIKAFAPIAHRADLIFTGPPWFTDGDIADAAGTVGSAVRHLGRVPRRHLAGLYSAASALAYPTRFEGFGAPALEAMAQGCPVIASNVTAVPEVVGQAGILLDPDDTEAWTRAMTSLLDDPELKRNFSEAGRERAARFSWERAADLQLAAYERAIGR